MADNPKVLLDLDTLVSRSTIKIDGEEYELRAGDEFSAVENHRLRRRGLRIGTLMDKNAALKEAEEKELSRLLDELCREILLAPDEVHARLRDTHRFLIAKTFTRLQQDSLRLQETETEGETAEADAA